MLCKVAGLPKLNIVAKTSNKLKYHFMLCFLSNDHEYEVYLLHN